MAKVEVATGYFKNGLPYTRIGSGPRDLVIFDGLDFSHRPPSGQKLRMISSSLKRLAKDFSPEDRAALFYDTAAKVYRLGTSH